MAKKITLTDLLNNNTFKVIYEQCLNMALNLFKWENLPSTIKEEYIENLLITTGTALFFEDKLQGLMCLSASSYGGLNTYGEATKYRATGYNYTKTYAADNCVLICNNKLRTNTVDALMMYVNKIYEIERTADVNIKTMKVPFIFGCNKNNVLSIKTMYEKIERNEPAVFVDNDMDLEKFNVFQTGAKLITSELSDYRHDVWNELLSFLGINNANTDKRERLNTSEVESNNDFIKGNAQIMLEARQRACDEINELYVDKLTNGKVSVSLRNEIVEEGDPDDGNDGDDKSTDGNAKL